jgi:hypothetical protein
MLTKTVALCLNGVVMEVEPCDISLPVAASSSTAQSSPVGPECSDGRPSRASSLDDRYRADRFRGSTGCFTPRVIPSSDFCGQPGNQRRPV